MRGREFIMKDAYSFDMDEAGLEKSYQIMYETYDRIFKRFGLNFKAVLAAVTISSREPSTGLQLTI